MFHLCVVESNLNTEDEMNMKFWNYLIYFSFSS